MRYKLPEGVACEHCVLQWYWATANSCAPPGFLDFFVRNNNPFGTTCPSDGGGKGAHRPGMTECRGSLVPEEFWSCADVRIVKTVKKRIPETSIARFLSPTPHTNDHSEGEIEEIHINPLPSVRPEETNMPKNEENELCVPENNECDGTISCCENQQVCVYVKKNSVFLCRFWWSLYSILYISFAWEAYMLQYKYA